MFLVHKNCLSSLMSSTTTSIPVLLVPGHLTKHLKVFLDKAAWRDKTKLITRYSQIPSDHPATTTSAGSTAGVQKDSHNGCDLTQYMAMALLPVGPFSQPPTAATTTDIRSLWDRAQDPSSPPSTDLSSIDWPAPLSDPTLQKTIFLTWLLPKAFPSPKHLLVQTPLEKLQQTTSEFLLPYLQLWAATSDPDQQGQQQQQEH